MPEYATRDVARKLGLSLITLKRYIASKKIPIPPLKVLGNVRVRVWSDRDIEAIRAVLPSIKNGRKIRYQKQQQSALSTQQSAKAKSKAKPKSSSRKRKPNGSKR